MKRIMTVDDSSTMRQMVKFALARTGHEVIEASNGKQALSVLNGREVHLFLLDLNMPEMDGIELIRRLRSMPEYKFVPMILLTTESNNDKKQQSKAAGATGWIVKPFEPDKLIAVVNKVMR